MSISRKVKKDFGVRGGKINYRLRTFLRYAVETPEGYRVKCWICGNLLALEEMTTDHIMRRRDGGKHNSKNLKPACLACNQKRD